MARQRLKSFLENLAKSKRQTRIKQNQRDFARALASEAAVQGAKVKR